MGKYLGATGLTYLWGKIKSIFATKTELAGHPTGRIYYGTCSTTANTYIKEATVETFPLDENDKPLVGTVVAIKYSVSNTYKTEGQTYALNVNNTGTYPMYYNNAAVATSTSANTLVAGYKNRHVFYVFNGTQWVWLSASYDTNTTYSGMTQAEVDAGTDTTARLITPARLRDNFYTEDEVDTLLGSKANSNDLATVATSGSYNDLDDTPTIPTVPTNVSAFNNDAGYLTSYTESDPTVPAWAKAANKPSYTASEVGALPDSTTIPSASTDTPQMDGTGAAGSASTYSKGDHVHPTDTSREARVTTVSHGTNDTTFALTPNVLHTWGTINSLTLTLASGSSTYVDGYWFKFTAGSSFTELVMPSGVNWVVEPAIESGKTYEVMIVDDLASYITDDIQEGYRAKTKIVNHGTSDTTYTLTPNSFHIWGEVASLTLSLQPANDGFVNGYWFRFTSGTTPTTLTLPSGIQWYYDDEVNIEASKTYEVCIVEGYAVYTEYVNPNFAATKTWVQAQGYLGPSAVATKADNVEIVAASGTTLEAEINKMYVFSSTVTTLAITLPTIASSNTYAQALSIFLTTGTSPDITFSAATGIDVGYLGEFELEDATSYEFNALWNGTMWVVGFVNIVTN